MLDVPVFARHAMRRTPIAHGVNAVMREPAIAPRPLELARPMHREDA
jgi:hypothetical protein